jgi:hypothetical protein
VLKNLSTAPDFPNDVGNEAAMLHNDIDRLIEKLSKQA